MVRSANSGPGDRPIERVLTTFDEGVRAVKTWWKSRETAEPGDDIASSRLVDEPHEVSTNGISNAQADALVAQVTAELDRFREESDGHDTELLHALQRLATSYEHVVAQLESDRRERRMLAEAVLRLERRLSAAEHSNGERVTGGWVTPEPDPIPLAQSTPGADRADEVDRINELFGHPVSERN